MVYYDSKKKEDEEGLEGQPVDNSNVALSNNPLPQAQNTQQPKAAVDKGSGFFTNLNEYIDANKGASEGFAKNVSQGLEKKVDTAKETLGSEAAAFQTEVEKNTNKDEGGVFLNNAKSNIGGKGWDKGSDNWNQLSDYVSGEYKGPDAFVSEQGINDIGNAEGVIKNSTTRAGKGNVLDSHYSDKKIDARAGEKDLDSIFLHRDKNANQVFKNLYDTNITGEDNLQSVIDNTVSTSNNLVGDAKTTNQNTATDYRTALSGAYNTTAGTVGGRVKTAQKEYDNSLTTIDDPYEIIQALDAVEGFTGTKRTWNSAINDFEDKDFSTEGFSGYNRGINLKNFIDSGLRPEDWRNVITPEEQAKLNALYEIMNPVQDLGEDYAEDIVSWSGPSIKGKDKLDAILADYQKNTRLRDKAEKDRKQAEEDYNNFKPDGRPTNEAVEEVFDDLGSKAGLGDQDKKNLSKVPEAIGKAGDFFDDPQGTISVNGASTTFNDGLSHVVGGEKASSSNSINDISLDGAATTAEDAMDYSWLGNLMKGWSKASNATGKYISKQVDDYNDSIGDVPGTRIPTVTAGDINKAATTAGANTTSTYTKAKNKLYKTLGM